MKLTHRRRWKQFSIKEVVIRLDYKSIIVKRYLLHCSACKLQDDESDQAEYEHGSEHETEDLKEGLFHLCGLSPALTPVLSAFLYLITYKVQDLPDCSAHVYIDIVGVVDPGIFYIIIIDSLFYDKGSPAIWTYRGFFAYIHFNLSTALCAYGGSSFYIIIHDHRSFLYSKCCI